MKKFFRHNVIVMRLRKKFYFFFRRREFVIDLYFQISDINFSFI